LGLLVALGTVYGLKRGRTTEPAAASVDRLQLELRQGKFYRPDAPEPFTGWVIDYFEDGTVKLRSAVLAGRLHGESSGWFTNGGPELCEHFQEGLPHGLRTTWHPNGQKRSEGQLEAGRQQGVYRQWDEHGKQVVEAGFVDGKPHGPSLAWYPNGSLKAEALMQHGEVQARQVYPAGTRSEPTLVARNPIPLSPAQLK
jgi:antitoxin component YwqK of YwqJK toxin-antitoxin module